MAYEKLTLDALRKLDGGRIAEAFDQAVDRARDDCIDRPGTNGARKVSLIVEFKSVQDADTGGLDSVEVSFDVKEVIPPRKSRKYNMDARESVPGDPGGLFFQPLSPERHNQGTFAALDESDGESSAAVAGA